MKKIILKLFQSVSAIEKISVLMDFYLTTITFMVIMIIIFGIIVGTPTKLELFVTTLIYTPLKMHCEHQVMIPPCYFRNVELLKFVA